jgi:hypothetical protein
MKITATGLEADIFFKPHTRRIWWLNRKQCMHERSDKPAKIQIDISAFFVRFHTFQLTATRKTFSKLFFLAYSVEL